MSCPCDFPEYPSWECVMDLVSLKANFTIARIPEAMRHCACLIGSAANVVSPDSMPMGDCADDDLDSLVSKIEEADDLGVHFGGAADRFFIGLIIRFAEKILEWLREQQASA